MLPLSYSMKNYETCVRLICYMFFSLLCWNWPYTTFIDALSGADHLTFESGEGGDFGKKNSCKGLSEEKSASTKNGIKKFLHCCKPCKKEKCYQVISSFRKLYKTPAKLQPFFPCSLLNSGFGDAVELLLHISTVLQSTYQEHFLLFLFYN